MGPKSAMLACTVVALALGACSSSPNRSSSFAGNEKSSVGSVPAQTADTASVAGSAASSGGQTMATPKASSSK